MNLTEYILFAFGSLFVIVDPIAVVPVLFHLLWCHELTIDLSTPLHQATLVSRSAGQR